MLQEKRGKSVITSFMYNLTLICIINTILGLFLTNSMDYVPNPVFLFISLSLIAAFIVTFINYKRRNSKQI